MDDKVFFSTIKRTYNKANDDLYELLKVDPAIPIPTNCAKIHECDFQPRNGKQFIPKKKNKPKVKTVRDIRNLYEKDVMSELPLELEKQQSILFRKIRGGNSREEKTKSLVKNMLNSNKPITRSSWQMMMNINPEGHTHSIQFVLWNGKSIRVNGSKGGKTKFVCNYDVGKTRKPFKSVITKNVFKKKGLLRNSLSVNFKPGPLALKKYLDNSYQKYHVGSIDVIDLPKPGLEIQPMYGNALDPTICNFVNSLREENGTITEKWAQFAVSVVGCLKGPKMYQLNDENCVTFDLNYQHDKTRLLIRRDQENKNVLNKLKRDSVTAQSDENGFDILPEVRTIMDGILGAVEINVMQDDLFMEDDEIRDSCNNDTIQYSSKEKLKRKYCELDRLAVTVIRLAEDNSVNDDMKCQKSHCALGCVCASLSTINLKGHCGRLDCMFKCKCDFSKQKWIEGFDNDRPDLLPGLLNLNNKINCNLSKEEQKFHQTVIMTGDKSILLKSKKRNTKSSKKYAEYYSKLSLKSESKAKPAVLAIIEPRLNCENVEPLCMVHNLYKCFCKGRFTDSLMTTEKEINKPVIDNETGTDTCNEIKTEELGQYKKEKDAYVSTSYNTRTRRETAKKGYTQETIVTIDLDDECDTCSRVKPYEGRKYSNGYYRNANRKIKDMEINDTSLRRKLFLLTGKKVTDTDHPNISSDSLSNDTNNDNIECQEVKDNPEVTNTKSVDSPTLNKSGSVTKNETTSTNTINKSKLKMIDSLTTKRLSNKPKLVAWLESSYQQYKRRLDSGGFKATLEAPKKGKVALYPWDFILSRYSERKNLFLVTKDSPYRIFMAVNASNPLFENCINIDDIRFADLNKYPTSVKNLLTNTSDLKDYFCILFGLNHCWEFIGSVTKVSDPKDISLDEESLESEMVEDVDEIPNYDSDSHPTSVSIEDIDCLSMQESAKTCETETQNPGKITEELKSECSKWFIMTIENDFTEIQFYNRGFFVKYASIVQAINVARTSGKTVRLSSQKLADNNGPQFGIYAVPSANNYCVFVGPYEIDEPLGIETIKSSIIRKAKRTRGVWITTGKVDNVNVIDNPLSFIPTQTSNMVPLDSASNESKNCEFRNSLCTAKKTTKTNPQNNQDNNDSNKTTDIVKVVKPIKICKTNGFYHLTKQSLLKPYKLKQSAKQVNTVTSNPLTPVKIKPRPEVNKIAAALDNMPIIIAGCDTLTANNGVPSLMPISKVTNIHVIKQARPVAEVAPQIKIASVYSEANSEKPVAEVAPQIKIAAVYSEASQGKPEEMKKKEGGMFILKPEEINQRIESTLNSATASDSPICIDDDDTMDVEYFLDNSDVCPAPVNLFSDEENLTSEDTFKPVFLECKNVDLGVIRATLNKSNFISFEFPGFKASEFYEPELAFTKLNQILSRKVYISNDLKLEWHIVDSVTKLGNCRYLESKHFDYNVILTERGLEKIRDNTSCEKYSNIKTYSRKERSSSQLEPDDQMCGTSQEFENASQIIKDVTFSGTGEVDNVKSIVEATDTD